jgi:hypothetical protein
MNKKLSKPVCYFFLLQLAILMTCAQSRFSHLKKWKGQHAIPSFNRGLRNKPKVNFFELPEIRPTLKKLLSPTDFEYLRKTHTKEVPFQLIDGYLKLIVCGTPKGIGCDNHSVFLINLTDGAMYAAFDMFAAIPRYYGTKGKFTDLPKNLQSHN